MEVLNQSDAIYPMFIIIHSVKKKYDRLYSKHYWVIPEIGLPYYRPTVLPQIYPKQRCCYVASK